MSRRSRTAATVERRHSRAAFWGDVVHLPPAAAVQFMASLATTGRLAGVRPLPRSGRDGSSTPGAHGLWCRAVPFDSTSRIRGTGEVEAEDEAEDEVEDEVEDTSTAESSTAALNRRSKLKVLGGRGAR